MKELTEVLISYWCAGAIGFFIGGFVMFLLSCLHFAKRYDDKIGGQNARN